MNEQVPSPDWIAPFQ